MTCSIDALGAPAFVSTPRSFDHEASSAGYGRPSSMAAAHSAAPKIPAAANAARIWFAEAVFAFNLDATVGGGVRTGGGVARLVVMAPLMTAVARRRRSLRTRVCWMHR